MKEHPFEAFAVSRFPQEGRCPHSPFANGVHRVGIVPVLSVLDGGASGDSAVEVCLHCDKRFKQRWFVIRKQPNRIAA